MAVAVGVGAGELLWWAAAAIAGLFVVTSPAGQRAAKEAAKSLSRESETVDVAPPKEDCDKKCPPCPPCPAPPPPRTDIVPPSRPHYPCPGSHTHVYRYESNQNPRTCECFCN